MTADNTPLQPEPPRCKLPPEGWACGREPGHEGPCATYPVTVAFKGHTDSEGRHIITHKVLGDGTEVAIGDVIMTMVNKTRH